MFLISIGTIIKRQNCLMFLIEFLLKLLILNSGMASSMLKFVNIYKWCYVLEYTTYFLMKIIVIGVLGKYHLYCVGTYNKLRPTSI